MINLKDLEVILREKDVPKEVREEFLRISKPFYELNDYISKKLDISDEAANKLFELHFDMSAIEKDFKDLFASMSDEQFNDEDYVLKETFRVTSRVFSEGMSTFCIKYKYPKTEELLSMIPDIFEMYAEMVKREKEKEKKETLRSDLN